MLDMIVVHRLHEAVYPVIVVISKKTKFMHTGVFLSSSPSKHKPQSSKMTPESIATTRKMTCAILCVLDSVIGICVERKIKQTARLAVFMVVDDAYCL
jgi:hypothetical protein